MEVYVAFFLAVIILPLLMKKELTVVSFFILFLLFLIIGLRDIYVGTDTFDYVTNDFLYLRQFSFKELMNEVSDKNEPLFFIITWLIGQVSDNYSVFLLFWAAFPMYALYSIFKRELTNTYDVTLAILVFFILGLFSFFVAGIRQTTTIAIVLYCFKYLKEPIKLNIFKESRLWKFVILMVIGYYIHNSILIFAVILPFIPLLQRMRVRWWYIIPVVLLFFIGSFIEVVQIRLLVSLLFSDRFDAYGDMYQTSLSSSAFIMQLLLFLICFSVRDKLAQSNKANTLLMNFALLALVFQSMAGMIGEMFRVSYYYSIFYIILIPRAINILSYNNKTFIFYMGFVLLSIFFLFFLSSAHLPEYHFAFKF